MLEILLGTDWIANSDELMLRLAADVKAARPNRILLVPELISHETERRLCSCAGDTTSRFAKVLSFSRLSRVLAERSAQPLPLCLDNGGRMIAMASAARQLHGSLKAFASVETKPEFLSQMVDAVDEFKRCGICAKDLLYAADRSTGELAQKTLELGMLLDAYDAICANSRMDPRDLMGWVLDELEDSDFAQQHVLYVDGFPDLTRQNMAILEHFIRNCPQVVVSMTCDTPDSDRLAFEKAGQTAAELIRIAKRVNVDVKITKVSGRSDHLKPLRRNLMQGSLETVPQLREMVTASVTESAHDECYMAASEVMRHVLSGSRYRDISIVCADMGAYRPVLELVLDRMGIPFYLAGTEPVGENVVLGTLFAALDAVLCGFEQKSMLRYIRTALIPISAEDIDIAENYAVVWNVQGNGWKQPWDNHPEGLSGRWSVHSREQLCCAEETRLQIMQPLQRLQAAMSKSVRLAEQVRAVKDFLQDIQFRASLENLSAQRGQSGDLRGAQILDQLWDILSHALDQVESVLGNTAWDGEAFVKLLRLLLNQYDVGTIPSVLDAVHIGPVNAMRCQREKHLIVLGCAEGSLPGYSGSEGLLNDQERDALRSLDLPLTGGALEGIQAEFAEVYGVFCGAIQTVSVYCGGAEPSYIFHRIATLAGGAEMQGDFATYTPDAFASAAMLVRLGEKETANRFGVGAQYDTLARCATYCTGSVSPENVRKLYGNQLTLSASQVDRQAECRMSYFLKYGLKLTERKPADVDPAEFGTFVHAVLEKTVSKVMELGGFQQISLEQTLKLSAQYAKEYADVHFSRLDCGRMEYLFNKNLQELDFIVAELWDELHQAGYLPIAFELGFGPNGTMPAIEINDGAIPAKLIGFVDRVDKFEGPEGTYFRVVDYKTGKKSFDYCDVFNGIGLQMLLYLFALQQEGKILLGSDPIPGGVQYFPARAPYLSAGSATSDLSKERQKGLKRSGLLLMDGASLNAMDPQEGMPRLPCSVSKTGSVTGDLADHNQMEQLRNYVFRLLANMVDEIASGNVSPNPYTRGNKHDACQYCPYTGICGGLQEQGRRDYMEMNAQRFWDELGKEMTHHG